MRVKAGNLGVNENAKNLSNKIARGGFTVGFFIMRLEAIGVRDLKLE